MISYSLNQLHLVELKFKPFVQIKALMSMAAHDPHRPTSEARVDGWPNFSAISAAFQD
ncbi:hypothetical protein [Gemmobacter caeruleus]|uniref:hypothetical protein n=1 Tax=Gemmobacter caeruleus TaxID=2595004 RepID=UPI001396CABD|nr:hypothetical protein [Gemmobacter caeruleus]